MASIILTDKVIDLNAARAARKARPFQGRLLKNVAAGMDRDQLATVRAAIADGFAAGTTTAEIVRRVLRAQVAPRVLAEQSATTGMRVAIFDSFATSDTTAEIARSIVRDQVRQRASAAL